MMNKSNNLNIINIDTINDIIKKYTISNEYILSDAINYSLFQNSKRIRPLLMLYSFNVNSGTSKAIEPFIAAIEMIHTYSLIHDDLPAMDNDSLRRGMPTNHIKYGEDMAILAGDALLNLSIETALKSFEYNDIPYIKTVNAMNTLYYYSGINGMILGQSLDIKNENNNKNINQDELFKIYNLKTAGLIKASFEIGTILSNANDENIKLMSLVGEKIGIAFQIKDDLLDIIGDEKITGKKTGSDKNLEKKTIIDFIGIENTENIIEKYTLDAITLIKDNFPNSNDLCDYIKLLIYRDR